MSGYVVLVDFRLKPGTRTEFRRLIDANARASATTERGCRRFDVLEPAGEADRVILYEIYDDRDAFDAHKTTEHFAAFDHVSADLVTSKAVTQCELACEGSG